MAAKKTTTKKTSAKAEEAPETKPAEEAKPEEQETEAAAKAAEEGDGLVPRQLVESPETVTEPARMAEALRSPSPADLNPAFYPKA